MRRRVIDWTRHVGLRCCNLGVLKLTPGFQPPMMPVGLRVAPFEGRDLHAFGEAALDVTVTDQRLAGGDRAWGLWQRSELLAYGWSSTRPTAILTLATLEPRPGEAYLFGFYTPPTHRGKGYYPLLLQSICAQLAQEGTHTAWIAVFAENHASWRGVEKAGFRRAARQLTVRGRMSLILPAWRHPQPRISPRRRGIHLRLGPPNGANPARAGF